MNFSSLTQKAVIISLLMVLCVSLNAQRPAAAAPKQSGPKKFSPANKRDPFLSREEVESIEAARVAEIKRVEGERKRIEEEERARRAEIERQKLLAEELAKNPAREIINKIRIDGIVGREAIINGDFKAIGGTVLGAKITAISETTVTFVYKGQTFVKKLPSGGVGVI